MNLKDKIYIAGHSGLVGSAIVRQLKERGFVNLVTRTHKELDLINQARVQGFFKKEKPDYVVLAAAKVGGIHANTTYPADFIYRNLMIESNVINSSYENNVKRLLFLGSTCIYPKAAQQPMRENALLTGELEPTNEPYALAKIAGIKLCESYNRQYNTDFRSAMPTNLYGINDNFHPENSHVIPALMQRFHKAKISNASKVVVWGTGNVMREFLYVDDMAAASIFLLALNTKSYKENIQPMISHINIGSGKDITIRELAETMKQIVGYKGKIIFDSTKPDGAPRKLIDTSRLSNLGWKYRVDLKEGLEKTYEWCLKKSILK
jgi:GDP-L-fucose synthase